MASSECHFDSSDVCQGDHAEDSKVVLVQTMAVPLGWESLTTSPPAHLPGSGVFIDSAECWSCSAMLPCQILDGCDGQGAFQASPHLAYVYKIYARVISS